MDFNDIAVFDQRSAPRASCSTGARGPVAWSSRSRAVSPSIRSSRSSLIATAIPVPSSSEANRLIDGGGVRVDSSVVSDKGLKLAAGSYVVQVGKRKFAKVVLG